MMYHCFDQERLKDLCLHPNLKEYKYFWNLEEIEGKNQHNCLNNKIFYTEKLKELESSFKTLELTQPEVLMIWRSLSLILNFGNVEFEAADDASSNPRVVSNFATDNLLNLLKINFEKLEELFLYNTIEILSSGSKTSERAKRYNSFNNCYYKRDSIAKTVYRSLFNWMVSRLSSTSGTNQFNQFERVSILDLPGFENFEKNSLEQLCINYGNEKTQELFREYYFKEETELFDKEGLLTQIQYKIDYGSAASSEEHIRVIDNPKRPFGIFQILQTASLKKNDNNIFIENLLKELSITSGFKMDRLVRDKFTIEHSIGKISYSVEDFVTKDIDYLSTDLLRFFQESQTEFQPLGELQLRKEDAKSSKNAGQSKIFTNGLKELMKDLKDTKLNFVRCVRANSELKPFTWDLDLIAQQIRYLDIKTFLKVKRQFFPSRMEYKDFCCKYIILNIHETDRLDSMTDRISEWKKRTKELINILFSLDSKKNKEDEVLYGKTKIFLSPAIFTALEEKLENYMIKLNSVRETVKTSMASYKLRNNWKIFIKDLRIKKSIAKKYFGIWVARETTYLRFLFKLETIEQIQRNFRKKILGRKMRLEKTKSVFKKYLCINHTNQI